MPAAEAVCHPRAARIMPIWPPAKPRLKGRSALTRHNLEVGIMDLAALDRRVASEAAPDRLGERLRAVDDEQTRHRWIEAALDQVVDQCLHHSAVLGCPFHQPERVLEALAID